MENFKFDQLISQSIKRLTRPKFRNDFPHFYDEKLYHGSEQPIDGKLLEVVTDQEDLKELLNICDVSYHGVPASAALNFNPVFGKISQGEHFKVLFTIQNSNAVYNIDQLEIKCVVTFGGQDQNGQPTQPRELKLLTKVIPQLGPKEQLGFVFAFRVDHLDNYQMQIDMNYTSKHFTEQLNKFVGANEDIDPYSLSSSQAQIDFIRRKVTRHQSKKYKFEANRPFEVSKNIALRDNKYFLQVKVTNLNPNKIFPSQFNFLLSNSD